MITYINNQPFFTLELLTSSNRPNESSTLSTTGKKLCRIVSGAEPPGLWRKGVIDGALVNYKIMSFDDHIWNIKLDSVFMINGQIIQDLTAAITLSAGTNTLTGHGVGELSGRISGPTNSTLTIALSSDATLAFSGTNAHTGPVSVTGGSIDFSNLSIMEAFSLTQRLTITGGSVTRRVVPTDVATVLSWHSTYQAASLQDFLTNKIPSAPNFTSVFDTPVYQDGAVKLITEYTTGSQSTFTVRNRLTHTSNVLRNPEAELQFFCVMTENARSPNSVIQFYNRSNPRFFLHAPWGNGNIYFDVGRDSNRVFGTLSVPTGTKFLLCGKNSSSDRVASLHVNSALIGTRTAQYSAATSPHSLGSGNSTGLHVCNSWFYEDVICRPMNSDSRLRMESLLANLQNMSSSLAASNPYKSTTQLGRQTSTGFTYV